MPNIVGPIPTLISLSYLESLFNFYLYILFIINSINVL